MTASRVQEDEPESDDQGQQFNTPLIQKPVLMIDGIDSTNTLMTSPCSSLSRNTESTLVFNDNIKTVEIDCYYTDEEIAELWFTKTEYDNFLQSCDEDAQKCEARVKELRVAKLKKEIRKQRRQRRKEENRRQSLDHPSAHENNLMDDDIDDDIADDSLEGDNPKVDANNNDNEEPICPLGLEAWTLEGYQTREHHRQKAMDAVLNEQYAAWDRGLVENTEMMSALYFAASATSKHNAAKRGKELEEDVKEFMVVSTLEDYNRAVQTLNVLQKSLYCIKIKNQRLRPKPSRRGSNENIKTKDAKMNRRGSNESSKSSSKTNRRSSSVDRTMAVMDAANDRAPQPPMNALSDGSLMLKSDEDCPPQKASSTTARNGKKIKPRGSKISGTPHKVYKSKASMNIIVAPPTPPTVKARRVTYKPSVSVPDLMAEDPTPAKKSPKSRKVAYKHSDVTLPKAEESSKSIKTSKSSKTTKSTENRPKLKGKSRRRSISPGPMSDNKDRSSSPKREGARSKSRRKLEGDERSRSKSRSKSPRVERERSRSKSRSKSPKDTPEDTPKEHRSRKKSPGRFVDKIRTKSPRPSARKLLQKMNPNKEHKHVPDVGSVSTTENASSLSTHGSFQGNKDSKKDQHWWFSQPRQEVQ